MILFCYRPQCLLLSKFRDLNSYFCCHQKHDPVWNNLWAAVVVGRCTHSAGGVVW